MNTAQTPPAASPGEVIRVLRENPRRWLVPTIALALVAVVYALVRPHTWEASQALIIRDEATIAQDRPGAFSDLTEMKTAQETIFELMRSKSVLWAALTQVGPPTDETRPEQWPTDKDVENFREKVKMTPPGGAEFGKTEVFYLKVRDREQSRAVALADAMATQLEKRFQSLREAKARSVVSELLRTEKLAEADLGDATRELAAIEKEVGVDLAELRMMHNSSLANSDLRQKLVEVENEVRSYEAAIRQNEQLLELLHAAAHDPGRLLASPTSLLESQPGLRRLKGGLVDAQLNSATLQGSMSAEHPLVMAAVAAEQEIGERLHYEIAIAIKGIKSDLAISSDRVETLRRQLATDRQRLSRLAELRADYANLVAKTQNRTQLLETARANVAQSRADLAASPLVNLIGRIDTPDTGTNPVGPRKAVIGIFGLIGGLLTGLGVLFLTTGPTSRATNSPPTPSRSRPNRESYVTPSDVSFSGALRKLDREDVGVSA